MLLENFFRFIESRAHRHRHQAVFCHHRAHWLVQVALKSQVAIRHDAHKAHAARHRQARDLVLVHDVERLPHRNFRRDRDRVHDHSAFRPFHAVHFFRLAVDRHVAVNETDAALASHSNREARVRHRIHRRRHDRNVDRDFLRQAGARVGLRRKGRTLSRQEQHVVKREPFGDRSINHCFSCGCAKPPRRASVRGEVSVVGAELLRETLMDKPRFYRVAAFHASRAGAQYVSAAQAQQSIRSWGNLDYVTR